MNIFGKCLYHIRICLHVDKFLFSNVIFQRGLLAFSLDFKKILMFESFFFYFHMLTMCDICFPLPYCTVVWVDIGKEETGWQGFWFTESLTGLVRFLRLYLTWPWVTQIKSLTCLQPPLQFSLFSQRLKKINFLYALLLSYIISQFIV